MNTLKVELKEAERFLKDGWFLVEKKEGNKWFLGIQLMETTGSFGNGDFESKNKIVINEPVQLVSESGEKYRYCPECKESSANPFYICFETGHEVKPLIVVPKKIEDAGKNWKVS